MTVQLDSKTIPGEYNKTPRVEQDTHGEWHIRGYAEAKELLKEDLHQAGFKPAWRGAPPAARSDRKIFQSDHRCSETYLHDRKSGR